MAIRTINKMNTKDEGISNPVNCPSCGVNTGMRLFSTVDTSLAALIAKEDKNLAFAVCPRCSAVFSLSKNYFRERTMGTAVIMTESDLEPMKR
ncbi:MAG: hypothetical protein PUC33_08840 [Oscillospiraceae bacterium]|nr:hypothetical protein [Oscillospiraceae bacterium]MDD6146292.1 hypothetical protein [Oscillospiraceae bacterium]